jgi:O-antigen/teichoic acid export membrane protein
MASLQGLYNSLKNTLRQLTGPTFFNFLVHGKNYLSSDIINKTIGVFTIPILTRILVPAEYGYLGIFITIVALTGILLDLNLRASITRYYFEDDLDFAGFLGSNFIGVLVFSGFILLPLLFFAGEVSAYWNIPSKLYTYALLTAWVMIPLANYLVYLTAAQRSTIYFRYNILFQTGTAVLSAYVIYWLSEEKFYGRAYVQLALATLIGIAVMYAWRKSIKWTVKLSHISKSLTYSTPLILHSLSGFILVSFDQLIINQLDGTAATGQYIFAYQIGLIMNMYVTSTNKSWIPIFYKSLKENKYRQITDLVSKYSKQTIIVAVGIILFSREIALILARENYYEALDIVPWVVLGYLSLFGYNLYAQYAFYRKKTVAIAVITLIASSVNIALNYWLIPTYGYKVAAITTFASYLLLFALHYVHTRLRFAEDQPFQLLKLIGQFGLPLLAWLVVANIDSLSLNLVFQVLIKTIIFGFLLFYVVHSIKKNKPVET